MTFHRSCYSCCFVFCRITLGVCDEDVPHHGSQCLGFAGHPVVRPPRVVVVRDGMANVTLPDLQKEGKRNRERFLRLSFYLEAEKYSRDILIPVKNLLSQRYFLLYSSIKSVDSINMTKRMKKCIIFYIKIHVLDLCNFFNTYYPSLLTNYSSFKNPNFLKSL